jgi:hypothetical protein
LKTSDTDGIDDKQPSERFHHDKTTPSNKMKTQIKQCGGSTTSHHTTAVWDYILRRRRFGSKGGKAAIHYREKEEQFLF